MRVNGRASVRIGVAVAGLVAPACAVAAALWGLTPLPPPRPNPVAAAVPLPPVRPPDLVPGGSPRAKPALPSRQGLPSAMPAATAPSLPPAAPIPLDQEYACLRLFASGKVVARAVAPIGGSGGCGIAAPVEVSAVIVSPAQRVRVEPAVTVDCTLGDAVADWIREDLVPAFASSGKPLTALTGTSGYACRGRNGIAGAKLSEHGRGNAMDVGGFQTTDGQSIGVRQAGMAVLASVRSTACARFATVLGPGSDGFHETHMHVDLEPRLHAATLCHWDQTPVATGARGPQ